MGSRVTIVIYTRGTTQQLQSLLYNYLHMNIYRPKQDQRETKTREGLVACQKIIVQKKRHGFLSAG